MAAPPISVKIARSWPTPGPKIAAKTIIVGLQIPQTDAEQMGIACLSEFRVEVKNVPVGQV